jgi:hypothetical protein
MAKVIIETVVTQTFKRVYELDIEDGVDAKHYVESGQSAKDHPLASYEFEPEGEDVVKVVSITSAADLEKQKLDEEKAQLKRELKEESNQPMTDKY